MAKCRVRTAATFLFSDELDLLLFHLLPEFDQGKRSCRRRLAGHNERRRKPAPGSLLSSRYGSLSSSIFENNSRAGSFMMDFTAYPNLNERDPWPTTRVPEGGGSTATGKVLPHLWQGSTGNPSPDIFLQGSPNNTAYSGFGIPSAECFTGIPDSSCALSLLSNQSWASRHLQPLSLRMGNSLNTNGGTSLVQPEGATGGIINQYSSALWGFKGSEASGSAQEIMPPDLALGQMSQPNDSQYSSGELELAHQGGRQQYMQLENSRSYDSSIQNLHWSL